MLAMNKIELAQNIGLGLEVMRADTDLARNGHPFIFGTIRKGKGVAELSDFIVYQAGFSYLKFIFDFTNFEVGRSFCTCKSLVRALILSNVIC